MKPPHLVVVDVETSGLDPRRHSVLEVAALDLTTHEELIFVPSPVVPDDDRWWRWFARRRRWQDLASPEAMKVNRYHERRVSDLQLDVPRTTGAWTALNAMLAGNLIAGANPEFDAKFVDTTMRQWGIEPRRRRQTRDLVTYAAGALDFDPAIPMRSGDLIDRLGITNVLPHSAEGDARAAAEAFQMIRDGKAPAGIGADLRASGTEKS
ncbi:MAG: exonuclease domain-containing protein [Dietzia sp.]